MSATSAAAAVTAEPILRIDNLSVDYRSGSGTASAVQDVSLELRDGETFGLVGESGCGKTTLAMAVMGLLSPAARARGRIALRGRDLLTMGEPARRRVRGNDIGMVFQDPSTSLDPTFSVGTQVAEALRAHHRMTRAQAKERAIQLLTDVGIPDAVSRYGDPPHRLSGGMRQRVVIAAAVANEPALLLADEPTTALDVTIQAQILDLLQDLTQRLATTVLLITHDLGVVAQTCDRVGVMYAGQLVEIAPVEQLFAAPRHPYTRALLDAVPTRARGRGLLRVVPGVVPDLTDAPAGCRFSTRCPHRMAICDTTPVLEHDRRGAVACWLHADADAVSGGESRG